MAGVLEWRPRRLLSPRLGVGAGVGDDAAKRGSAIDDGRPRCPCVGKIVDEPAFDAPLHLINLLTRHLGPAFWDTHTLSDGYPRSTRIAR